MSLLGTGRSELEQANYASKTSTDMANKRQAQKSSLEYQNDVANNNRNGALAGSAVNLGIAYAGYKHDQAVQESKGLSGQSGIEPANPTSNSIANNDAFRSGTSGDSINTSGAGGGGGIVGSDAGGQTFNQQVSGTAGSQGLAGSNATGSVVGSEAGGGALNQSLSSGSTPSTAQGSSSSGSAETTQSLNADVSNSSTPSGESSGGGSTSGGAGGAAGAAFLVGGLYQLFSSF
jgi:hypothetical protein